MRLSITQLVFRRKLQTARRVIRDAGTGGVLQSEVTHALKRYGRPRQTAHETVKRLLELGEIRRESNAKDGKIPPGKAGWRLFWVGK